MLNIPYTLFWVQTIKASLTLISASLRDIVVEILFRDLEYLLDKYMTDMRKVSTIQAHHGQWFLLFQL